eukprot:TRINITY_DN6543_c0_g2_i1.p1 TRINITY_DN6543_c0_g2~~TRINITY_DN6543_c0_g2_i1.p1  ORF type:complete len:610 (-),score=77.80 TRINITY_DN6543_c0_g2_i1:56-1846(-)
MGDQKGVEVTNGSPRVAAGCLQSQGEIYRRFQHFAVRTVRNELSKLGEKVEQMLSQEFDNMSQPRTPLLSPRQTDTHTSCNIIEQKPKWEKQMGTSNFMELTKPRKRRSARLAVVYAEPIQHALDSEASEQMTNGPVTSEEIPPYHALSTFEDQDDLNDEGQFSTMGLLPRNVTTGLRPSIQFSPGEEWQSHATGCVFERNIHHPELIPQDAGCSLLQQKATSVVDSGLCSVILSITIVINAVVIGWDTNRSAILRTTEEDPMLAAVNSICFSITFLDLVLRMLADGQNFFSLDENGKWNIFDFVMVGGQGIEEAGKHLAFSGKSFQWFGVIRLLRVFRVLRLLRASGRFGIVKETRILLVSISRTARSLCSAFFILMMMEFCLAVFFTQSVTNAKLTFDDELPADMKRLEELFGTMPQSMLTLYQSISSGINWCELEGPLRSGISPLMTFVIIGYVSFSLMALMNVITSIFINSAIRSAEEDQRSALVSAMQRLLEQCDEDGSGTINWVEFLLAVDSEESEHFFKEIDMEPEDALKLFKLLDVNNTGELESDELIQGCLNLQGPVKAITFAAFLHDFWKWTMKWDDRLSTLLDRQ